MARSGGGRFLNYGPWAPKGAPYHTKTAVGCHAIIVCIYIYTRTYIYIYIRSFWVKFFSNFEQLG